MNKNQLKELIKEMFKNDEIELFVKIDSYPYEKRVITTVEILIDNEVVASDADTAYLED